MTLEEAKDKVAIDSGYAGWNVVQLRNQDAFLLDAVAELYARSKWYEAVDEQRLNLSRLFDAAGGTLSAHYTMKELKRPEFK